MTKVVGIDSPKAILGCFLLGQHLAGEQGEALTLAGQGAFCRGKPTRRDASGLNTFKDAASDFHGRWDGAPAADGWGQGQGALKRRHWRAIAGCGSSTCGGYRGTWQKR